MAIETATYLNGLNASNRPDGDPIAQASNHLRLIKATIKATFPNLTGPVNVAQSRINNGNLPTGAIVLWSGATTAVPTGWALCDGGTYAKEDGSGNLTVPDLRNKFIVGAGSTYAVNATGGAAANTPTITVGGTVLTQAQMPSHNHAAGDFGHSHGAYQDPHSHTVYNGCSVSNGISGTSFGKANSINTSTDTQQPAVYIGTGYANISIGYVGGNASHDHPATSTSVPTLPPYLALAYIIRL